MVRANFFKSYQDMILTIIEDKPRYDIPIIVYKCVLFISLLQLVIHLFSDFSSKGEDDFKLKSAIQILNMVSIVNVLNGKQIDTLSLIIYFAVQLVMYFYFIYVAFLALAKFYMREICEQYKMIIIQTNEILNLYFTFYLNVFLTMYIELNYAILFCGEKSLFSQMRIDFKETNTCTIPTWQTIVGVIGIILSVLTAFITNYFFRNYEFLEKNVLKRKATFLFSLLVVIRILLPLFEINRSIVGALEIKHILNQVYGIICIINYYVSIPFRDQQISKFYLLIIAYYYSVVSCANLYLLLDIINGQEMFYMSIVLSLVIAGTLQSVQLYQYEAIMQGKWDLEKIIPQLDFYLEQMIQLGYNSSFSEEAKIQLIKHFKTHRSSCIIPNCICHTYITLNMQIENEIQASLGNDRDSPEKEAGEQLQNDINMRLLIKYVEVIFQWMLSQKCINEDNTEFEKLSLKYISFMIQYQNNPVRAYHELKILQLKKSSFSKYFRMITQIVSKGIQNKIENSLDEEGQSGINGRSNGISHGQAMRMQRKGRQKNLRSELTVQQIVEVEQLCLKFIPIFMKLIEKKQELWSKLQHGYINMNSFQVDAILLMKDIRSNAQQFNIKITRQLYEIPLIENSIQFQKLILIYNLFIANDAIKAIQIEQKINDLRKMDTLADPHSLKNDSLIKGEICVVQISLSENLGKITSKKDDKTAQFFGFNGKQDFAKVMYINDLLPDYVSRVHNQLVKNFLNGTSARAKNGGNIVFSYMKQNDGYIFPVKIQFDFSFNSSSTDLRFNGVLLKNSIQQDIIVFHRNGQIAGITKHLAEILFQDYISVIERDKSIHNLNILLLFPSIIKKLIKHKEFILNDLSKKLINDSIAIGDGYELSSEYQKGAATLTTLIEDQKGREGLSQNPFSKQNKFYGFTLKKNAMLKYEDIDILDQSSLDLLKSFEELDITQSSNRSQNSTDRKQFGQQMMKNTMSSNVAMTMIKTNSKNVTKSGNILEKKIKFDYSIQYCLLQQNSQNKSRFSKKQNNYNLEYRNQQSKQKKIEAFSDIYFTLRFDNMQQKLQAKKQEKKKNKESFLENLVTYFKSTTSLLLLSSAVQKASQLQKIQPNSQLENFDDISNLDSIPKISNIYTSLIDAVQPPMYLEVQADFTNIPKKMLKLISFQSQISSILNPILLIIINSLLIQLVDDDEGVITNKKQNATKYQDEKGTHGVEQSEQSLNLMQSQDSDRSEETDYQQIYQSIVNKLNSSKNSRDFIDAQNTEFETMMNNYNITKESLLKLDPNYGVKRILQNRTQCSKLSKALEFTISEYLVQYEIEQARLKPENKQIIANPMGSDENEIQCLTFRQPINYIQNNNQGEGVNSIQLAVPNQNILETQLNSSRISDTHYQPNEFDISENKFQYMNVEVNNEQDISQMGLSPIDFKETVKTDYNFTNINTLQNTLHTQNDISYRPIIPQTQTNYHTESFRQTSNQTLDAKEKLNKNPIKILNNNSNIKMESQIQESFQNISHNVLIKKDTNIFYKSIFNDQLSQNNQLNHPQKIGDLEKKQNDIKQNKDFKSFLDSTEKNNKQENENANDLLNSQAIAKILNQKGIGGGSIQKDSIHSSSKTSNNYAGVFLKEIILRCKIPEAAMSYKSILIIFLVSFIALNLTNLIIIQSDMDTFSTNVVILRTPRRFLRAYAKTMFGFYIGLESQLGYFQGNQSIYQNISNNYIQTGINEYRTLNEQVRIALIKLGQKEVQQSGEYQQKYYFYRQQKPFEQLIQKPLMFAQHEFEILSVNITQKQDLRIDSFLYLRQNFLTFANDVIQIVDFLVDDTLSTVDNLIYKFTIIIICAIFGVISVAIISLPIIKKINLYEEKIIMIVTRINFDQSEQEKTKLFVCQQLVNIDQIDWLNYNYFDIFGLQYHNNNQAKHHSSQHSQKANSNQKKVRNANMQEDKELQLSKIKDNNDSTQKDSVKTLTKDTKEIKITSKDQITDQYLQANQLLATQGNEEKATTVEKSSIKEKEITKKTNKLPSRVHKTQQRSNQMTRNNNYLLQSKIASQNLRIFDRFLTLLILTTLNCIYFLILIIYLTGSKDDLKLPVLMNRRSIKQHIHHTIMKISIEFLVIDPFIKDELWPNYQTEDIQDFYNSLQTSINLILQFQSENSKIIFGKNPFPSVTLAKLQDFAEGRGCQYLIDYKCQPGQEDIGIRLINTAKQRYLIGYQDILQPKKASKTDMISYLNTKPHLEEIVKGFQREDELVHLYSSFINRCISTVSTLIQSFLENYLIIVGTVLSFLILFVGIWNWRQLFLRLQYMNLLLTIIPEEKLQEEVTLHMIRQLHRM